MEISNVAIGTERGNKSVSDLLYSSFLLIACMFVFMGYQLRKIRSYYGNLIP